MVDSLDHFVGVLDMVSGSRQQVHQLQASRWTGGNSSSTRLQSHGDRLMAQSHGVTVQGSMGAWSAGSGGGVLLCCLLAPGAWCGDAGPACRCGGGSRCSPAAGAVVVYVCVVLLALLLAWWWCGVVVV